MPYSLRYTEAATRSLERLSEELQDQALQLLQLLAENPRAVSRPGAMPFPENCQMSLWPGEPDAEGVADNFCITFRYHQDEVSLVILNVGHWTTQA